MGEAETGLVLLILAGAAMRAAGLLVAGRQRPDHPFIQWAASVALATLAAFVMGAVAAPGGLLAQLPLPARLAGAAAALAVWAWRGGLLGPVLAGIVTSAALWRLL